MKMGTLCRINAPSTAWHGYQARVVHVGVPGRYEVKVAIQGHRLSPHCWYAEAELIKMPESTEVCQGCNQVVTVQKPECDCQKIWPSDLGIDGDEMCIFVSDPHGDIFVVLTDSQDVRPGWSYKFNYWRDNLDWGCYDEKPRVVRL